MEATKRGRLKVKAGVEPVYQVGYGKASPVATLKQLYDAAVAIFDQTFDNHHEVYKWTRVKPNTDLRFHELRSSQVVYCVEADGWIYQTTTVGVAGDGDEGDGGGDKIVIPYLYRMEHDNRPCTRDMCRLENMPIFDLEHRLVGLLRYKDTEYAWVIQCPPGRG